MLAFLVAFYFYVSEYWHEMEKFLSGVEKAKSQIANINRAKKRPRKGKERCYRDFIKSRGKS
jgi:hypothetical protein